MRKVTSDYGRTIILFRGMGFLKECIRPASKVSLIRTSRILHIGTLNDLRPDPLTFLYIRILLSMTPLALVSFVWW